MNKLNIVLYVIQEGYEKTVKDTLKKGNVTLKDISYVFALFQDDHTW